MAQPPKTELSLLACPYSQHWLGIMRTYATLYHLLSNYFALSQNGLQSESGNSYRELHYVNALQLVTMRLSRPWVKQAVDTHESFKWHLEEMLPGVLGLMRVTCFFGLRWATCLPFFAT